MPDDLMCMQKVFRFPSSKFSLGYLLRSPRCVTYPLKRFLASLQPISWHPILLEASPIFTSSRVLSGIKDVHLGVRVRMSLLPTLWAEGSQNSTATLSGLAEVEAPSHVSHRNEEKDSPPRLSTQVMLRPRHLESSQSRQKVVQEAEPPRHPRFSPASLHSGPPSPSLELLPRKPLPFRWLLDF